MTMFRLGGKNYIKNRRGAAIVEFAIVALLLILLVFGIIDFGLLLKDYIALNHVASEAARTVALGGNPDFADLADKCGLRNTPNSTIDPGVSPGDQVTVTLTYTHNMLTGLFGSTKSLSTAIVRRKE